MGVIPGGSTDAVALSIHGTVDVITATLHIILGDRRNIDVAAVFSERKLLRHVQFYIRAQYTQHPLHYVLLHFDPNRYSMTMVSYGYFGDLIRRSEKYRWLGPRRYDLSGTQTFLLNKSYEGTVGFLGSPVAEDPTETKIKCNDGCRVCSVAERQVSRTEPQTVVRGKFSVVTGATTSCRNHRAPKGVSPSAHLGDGHTDLILVKATGRINYLRYLLRTGLAWSSPFELSFVEVHRVRSAISVQLYITTFCTKLIKTLNFCRFANSASAVT